MSLAAASRRQQCRPGTWEILSNERRYYRAGSYGIPAGNFFLLLVEAVASFAAGAIAKHARIQKPSPSAPF